MAKDKPKMDRTTKVPSKKRGAKGSIIVGKIEVQQVLQKDIETGLFDLAEHNPQEAFGIAIKHIDQQWAIDAFLKLAKKYPEEGLRAAQKYENQSLIKNVRALIESKD